MKKIISLIITLLLIPLTVFANQSKYDSFIELMKESNRPDSNLIIDMLRENKDGWGGVPDLPEDIVEEDLVKLYKFDDQHIVNVYNEKGTLSENFDENYRFKYFCEETCCTAEIRKYEDGEWKIAISDMEIKYRRDRFPGQPCNFKEMIADVIKKYPALDMESVKYIEFDILGTYLVYFVSDDTEYITTYPLDDLQKEFEYGKVFTLSEFIDAIDEFPIFNRTEPLEGYGGADIGVVDRSDSVQWYTYLLMGVGVIIVGFIGYIVIKKLKTSS